MKLWHIILAMAIASFTSWAYNGFDWYALFWAALVFTIGASLISSAFDHKRMQREIEGMKRKLEASK